MRAIARAPTNLLIALSTGYVLFFYSERLFWTVLWPNTQWPELAITWLAYSAVAYLFLAVVRWSRADDVPSVFVAGAIYGWLIEGGVANTLYGTESSAPFPMSISLTALSWHALISVTLGWWATQRALQAKTAWPLVAISAAVGVFWGIWAMFPRQESPPVIVPVERFAAEAIVLTLLLAASWWATARAAFPSAFRPGWLGLTISSLAVGLFYVQHVTALGVRPLIMLPTLIAAALLVLTLHRRRREPISAEAAIAIRLRTSHVWALLATPAAATITFSAAAAAGWDRLPIAALVFQVTGILGFAMLLLSAAVITWRRVTQRVAQVLRTWAAQPQEVLAKGRKAGKSARDL